MSLKKETSKMKKIIITIDDKENVSMETDGDITHAELLGYLEMAKNGAEFEVMYQSRDNLK